MRGTTTAANGGKKNPSIGEKSRNIELIYRRWGYLLEDHDIHRRFATILIALEALEAKEQE